MATLADDIRAFMDVQHIEEAALIGHSIAGAEMTRFAAVYPKRVTALVYLDAAYDYGRAYELATKTGLAQVNKDDALEAIARAARVRPLYEQVRVPALAFFVLYDTPTMVRDLAYETLDASGYKRDQVHLFRSTVKRSRIVEWHDTNHMFFEDPKHVDDTPRIIREFLREAIR